MLKVGALRNGFTYGKLFHQLEEIVSELLRYLWHMGTYLRTRTKVCQTGGFLWQCQWVAIDVLIELCPMVPFIAKVPFVVSQPTSRYSDWITVTVGATCGLCVGFGFWSSVVSSRARDTRCSVFGWLVPVLYLLR